MTIEITQQGKLLAWYRDHVPAMPLATAKQHMMTLEHEVKVIAPDSRFQAEFGECLKLVTNRVDELLPKVPATVTQHDHSIGDRVKLNWPAHFQASTMYIHMHLCELLYAWNLNPYRPALSAATVDEYSETLGLTRFVFPTRGDAQAFINQYAIIDFVVSEQFSPEDNEAAWAVTFTNRFERDEVNGFLEIYNRAVVALTTIYDEQRRAVSIDNGKFGFVTADHFTTRETIELAKIRTAREKLGRGFKNTTNATSNE